MVLRPEHFSAKRLQNDTTTRQGFDRLVKRHIPTFGGEDGRVLFWIVLGEPQGMDGNRAHNITRGR